MDIINPLTFPRWDDLILTHSDHSFFHTSAWARVLHESYGYKPLYFTSIRAGCLEAMIPLMEVDSFITGRRGVSLPFSDFCPIIVPDESIFKDAIAQIIFYGKKAGWKYVEFRGGQSCLNKEPASSVYYTHTLDLSKGETDIFRSLRDSTRRNIKKAVKEHVETRISHSFDAVKDFYHLHCKTRRRHGLPPQPFGFFKNLHQYVISKRRGVVCLGRYKGKAVAGVIVLDVGKIAIYKYGASDIKYHYLRVNNLVMWETIKACIDKGLDALSFGRTEEENKGLLQFKRGWGVQESVIAYYRYSLETNSFVNGPIDTQKTSAFFKKMPLFLLPILGSLFYRHFG